MCLKAVEAHPGHGLILTEGEVSAKSWDSRPPKSQGLGFRVLRLSGFGGLGFRGLGV